MAGEGPMSSGAQSVGSVPSQGNAATVNPAEVLDQVLQRNTQELSKYALAAATPVKGGSQGQMPSSLSQPQRESHMAPLSQREVVGAGNAKARGIGNTITAALNTISAVKTGMDNKKKVEIASSTQQLLQAQAAANQAKQLLEADPNNTAAKEQIQHNEQIMGTILTGKHGKDIMKGFNIDYTDPESNKTPQHDAVADGKKRAEAATAAFNKGTPETMSPNTQAQAIYAAKAEEAKNTAATVRAMAPMISAQIRADAQNRATDGRITVEQMKDIKDKAIAFFKSQDGWDKLNARFSNAKEMEKIKHGDRLSEISHRATEELNNYKEKLTAKDSNPLQRQKQFDAFSAKAASTLSSMQNSLANLTYERSSLATNKGSAEELKRIDDSIYLQQQQIQQYKQSVDGSTAYYHDLLKLESGGSADAGRPDTSKPGLSSAAAYLDPSDSIEDDEDEQ